jgi:hypothetical protein
VHLSLSSNAPILLLTTILFKGQFLQTTTYFKGPIIEKGKSVDDFPYFFTF